MQHPALPIHPANRTAPARPLLAQQPILVQASDLPLSCPRPGDELWNMHPRVYLPIDEAPERRVVCPYCGALYQLDGDSAKAH